MTGDERLSFFGIDPRSTVSLREGRIVRTGVDLQLSRAILANEAARELMASGHLVDTRVIDESTTGPVLEHRRIVPFTYPGSGRFPCSAMPGCAHCMFRKRLLVADSS